MKKGKLLLGIVPAMMLAGVAQADLIFTEIMYDPTSPEPMWEWVEIHNTGLSTINLAGYVFDDINSVAHGGANIASGSIAAGGTAVLFNAESGISALDFAAAWGAGINLIAVSEWDSLNQGGDTIGLWDSFASYSGDHATHANAIVSLAYDDSGGWPNNNNVSSVWLGDLGGMSVGSNWILSGSGDGLSWQSTNTTEGIVGNSGGEWGNPGVVPAPGVIALLGIAGLAGSRRRRRD